MKRKLKSSFIFYLLSFCSITVYAQPNYDYSKPFLATSQLGFREESPKEISFFGGDAENDLPNEITFYITKVGYRLPRQTDVPKEWDTGKNVFRWPFNEKLYPYAKDVKDPSYGEFLYKSTLKKMASRWGNLWRGDFTDFKTPGTYQIETEYGFTAPFQIDNAVYEKLERGYLEFMHSQRSGVEIPGVRPMENADDARLDTDEEHYLPVAGGWNDAGDWRKWLFLTLPNLDALGQVAKHGHPAFKQKALEEMEWGNRYFHHMILDDGRVLEDVGGGINRMGDAYGESWWNENHPGVTAAGDLDHDNIPMNGIERHVRTNYNPLVQFQFIRHQALASTIFEGPSKSNSLVLADRAWQYAENREHDQRTIFVAQQLLAAIELYLAGSPNISTNRIEAIAEQLFTRQEINEEGLSGYFMEADKKDGYRSIAFNVEPAMALLRLVEANIPELASTTAKAKKGLAAFIENYALQDAKSNPFQLPPYGVYVNPPFPKKQKFRGATKDRFVRTLIHVFSDDPIPHGINQVFLEHGYLMARAGKFLGKKEWQVAAERILNWSMGHNTYGLCLFTGVGFKHPVPANFVGYKIPSAPLIGFLGTVDDQPYLENRNLVEWSTQEIWDVPFYFAIGLISYLD